MNSPFLPVGPKLAESNYRKWLGKAVLNLRTNGCPNIAEAMTEEEPKPKSVISPGQRERALGFTILYNSISPHLIPRLHACDTEDPCPYELIIEIRQKFSQTSPTEREESIVKLGKVTFFVTCVSLSFSATNKHKNNYLL